MRGIQMASEPGARLDGYELLRILGTGGMGEVWLARDIGLGRNVAIKLLPAELTDDARRVSRFEQEARAASALSHPNICHVYALGHTADGQRYIAMELVEGTTLRVRLHASQLSVADALKIACQIAGAVSTAHAAGIIHRDLKPENVMVRADSLVKVLDFGLAKLTLTSDAAVAGDASAQTVLRTDAGTVAGTVAYMSPEQARGQELDARTDIWSLGVLLYEMVAGRRPFAGQSSSDVVAAILEHEADPLTRFDPHVPPEMQRIVSKALRKDREQRYQGMRDLLLDLQTLRDEIDLQGRLRGFETGHTQAQSSIAVGQMPAENAVSQSSAEYFLRQVTRHKLAAAVALAAVGLAIGAVWWTSFAHRVSTQTPLIEPARTRLTANPADLLVTSARISPDGRYLAYADPTGIKVQFIDSGEVQRLPDTRAMKVYAWTSDSTKVRASACETGTCIGWDISLVGGGRRHSGAVWPEADRVTATPDGSRLLRLTNSGELKIDLLDGTSPRVLAHALSGGFIRAANWSADASRVLFTDAEGSVIESMPVRDGPASTVFTAENRMRVADLLAVPNHGVIAVLRRPDARQQSQIEVESSLWEVRPDSGDAPRRLTEWLPEQVEHLSASSDGTRLTFLSTSSQYDVYIADFDPKLGLTSAPKRLTLDERDDLAYGWTPDGLTVLFVSNRNGTFDIFKQRLDSDVAEPFVIGPGDQLAPAVTSDGSWVLYTDLPSSGHPRIMRVPLTGGTAELLSAGSGAILCSARGRCVLLEEKGSHFTVSALDPIRGKGAELGRVPSGYYGAYLSPDGDALAYIGSGETGRRNRIQVMSLKGDAPYEIVVTSATNLGNLEWLPNGSGLFSTDMTYQHNNLLFVTLDGASRVLWSPPVPSYTRPSPDGKRLALSGGSQQSTVWMLSTF